MTAAQVVSKIVKEKILSIQIGMFCGDSVRSGEKLKKIRKENEKSHAAGDFDNRGKERTPWKWFRFRYEVHIISNDPKPYIENEKCRKQVKFNEKGDFESQKECDNDKNNNDQKIYAYMARMSDNDKCSSKNFGDSSQLTNWILDSGATCHMMPEVSYFITGSLDNIDKHIDVADGHHVTEK